MRFEETWQWLQASPVFGLTLTLAAYAVGRWVHRRTGSALFQPVLVTIVIVVAMLLSLDIEYDDYLAGGQFIGFWLGPATVALALPLHREWDRIRRAALPVLTGVGVGTIVSVTSAILATRWTGGTEVLEVTLAPKATTTPVAIAISDQLGGLPALTAVVTILAGITGAMVGPWLLDRLRVHDQRARGIALGTASHGIGTSRALLESPTEGAFSALSMGLTALVTSLLVPVLVAVL